MNKHKLDYEAPEASTFVVRFEGCLCTSPGYNGDNNETPSDGGDEDF